MSSRHPPPTLSDLFRESNATIMEGQSIAIELHASIARLHKTFERTREIYELLLFAEENQHDSFPGAVREIPKPMARAGHSKPKTTGATA